jgi:hypothetical protein
MTKTKTFSFTINPVLLLSTLSLVLVILKSIGVLNWATGWLLLPWFIGMGMWLVGITTRIVAAHLVRRAKHNHPAFQRVD